MEIEIREKLYIVNSNNDDTNDSITIQRTDISKLIFALEEVEGVVVHPLSCEKKIEYHSQSSNPQSGIDRSLQVPIGFQMDREVFVREYLLRGAFNIKGLRFNALEMNLQPYHGKVHSCEFFNGVQCDFLFKCKNEGYTEDYKRENAEKAAIGGIRVIHDLKNVLTSFYKGNVKSSVTYFS